MTKVIKIEALPRFFNQSIWCVLSQKMVVLNPSTANGVPSATDKERVSLKETYPFLFKK